MNTLRVMIELDGSPLFRKSLSGVMTKDSYASAISILLKLVEDSIPEIAQEAINQKIKEVLK